MLELECKHGYLGYEQIAAQQYQHQQQGERPGRALQLVAPSEDERAPEEGIGRGGKSDEAQGLALVEIELGQTQC